MSSSSLMLGFEMIFLMLIFVGILFLAYWVTKKMSLIKQGGFTQKNMKIKECLPLGQGQGLYIVQIGKEYHLIGVSKEGIQYCTKLEGSQLEFDQLEQATFQNYLSKWAVGKQEKDDEKGI